MFIVSYYPWLPQRISIDNENQSPGIESQWIYFMVFYSPSNIHCFPPPGQFVQAAHEPPVMRKHVEAIAFNHLDLDPCPPREGGFGSERLKPMGAHEKPKRWFPEIVVPQ